MTIDRVATNSQSQYLLSQIMQAESNLNTTQAQVTSGQVSSEYSGYGDKTAVLEATRSVANRTTAYQTATTNALTQVNEQDSQLSSLSDLANSLRSAITTALANNDGSTLMTTAQGIFDQASQILNTKDANGNYLYGGDNNSQPPLSISDMSGLASPATAAGAFQNGTVPSSVMVADGQTVQTGVLASDAGTQLMATLKSLVDLNNSTPLSTSLTAAQQTALSTAVGSATDAATAINNVAAQNGNNYSELQDASANQSTMSNLYSTFVSNIQNVDMSTAITQLNQNQVALQAAVQVTAQLNQISLLNYLPATTTA
jgi:flagellar hook-associated protein 3 FlgL